MIFEISYSEMYLFSYLQFSKIVQMNTIDKTTKIIDKTEYKFNPTEEKKKKRARKKKNEEEEKNIYMAIFFFQRCICYVCV